MQNFPPSHDYAGKEGKEKDKRRSRRRKERVRKACGGGKTNHKTTCAHCCQKMEGKCLEWISKIFPEQITPSTRTKNVNLLALFNVLHALPLRETFDLSQCISLMHSYALESQVLKILFWIILSNSS